MRNALIVLMEKDVLMWNVWIVINALNIYMI